MSWSSRTHSTNTASMQLTGLNPCLITLLEGLAGAKAFLKLVVAYLALPREDSVNACCLVFFKPLLVVMPGQRT